MRPRVSVVMAVRNSRETIEEAVLSAVNQTIDDLEVIVVDDASTDGTGRILDKISRSTPKVRVIHLKSPVGAGPARNAGVLSAQGDFVAIADADDVSLPNRLERQIALLEDSGAAACGAWAVYETFEGQRLGIYRAPPVVPRGYWRRALFAGVPVVHPTLLVRKDLFLKTGGYPNLRRSEDYLFLLRLLRFSEVLNVQEPLYVYRVPLKGPKKYRLSLLYQASASARFLREVEAPPWMWLSLLVPLAKFLTPLSLRWRLRWRKGRP